MDEQGFKQRTKQAALAVIRLVDNLPRSLASDVLARQLLRASTSVGSNYRAACRAKSVPDMIAKLHIVEEESDESIFWCELLTESGILDTDACAQIKQEYTEILAMTVASIKTLRAREEREKQQKRPNNNPNQ